MVDNELLKALTKWDIQRVSTELQVREADDCPHLSEVLPSCRCRCWRCALLILTLATEAAVADDL